MRNPHDDLNLRKNHERVQEFDRRAKIWLDAEAERVAKNFRIAGLLVLLAVFTIGAVMLSFMVARGP